MTRWIGLTATAVALAVVGTAGPRAAHALEPQAAAAGSAPPAEILDAALAPIALYPDALLAQMLVCAGNPAKVAELSAWLKKMSKLKGTELQKAAEEAGYEPSFVALALFPQVVDQMAADPKLTGLIGRAFAADRGAVFDSIQRLRAKSQAAGNLKTTPQQTVETKTTEGGQQVIVIEPANAQVVYVPQYNPQVVYTQPASTTVVVQQESNDDAAVAGAVIGFAAGIAIGAAINNNYYYGPYGWHGGGYMYNDAWDDREDAREDYYEHREDAREDYQDHREDMAGERSERASNTQQQRTEAQQQRTERQQGSATGTSTEAQANRDQRKTEAQGKAQQARATGETPQARSTTATTQTRSAGGTTQESRGYGGGDRSQARAERSGTRSDSFSGYSSGKSTRAESSRGQRSRSSSGGGRSRRR
jgi:uncharacterized protein DUF3300